MRFHTANKNMIKLEPVKYKNSCQAGWGRGNPSGSYKFILKDT